MELKINLLEKKGKSRKHIIFGLSYLLFVIGVIVFDIINKETLFNYFTNGFYLLMGIMIFTYGLGYYFESFFGKAYILINSEIISLKSSVWIKEQFIYWNGIKSMDYKIDKFNIKKTDGTTTIISISKFDYKLMRKIKETVDCIAKEKNIQVNFGKWN